ncbi:hypothetical protein [Lignipirellula cremea]|uniref:Ferritin-like domain protein n=1 Tax=Lignipirellula cremea TaxID=2528010 RepID=A0A518DU89_9BACT|nr:hypothetical protein [Lignipirellula cremea]QDU95403.1 hypothetical protein Pla8534_32180 [Lignipirellula cremea]
MNSIDTASVLNRLAVILGRSLPMYLNYARPYALFGDDEAGDTLTQIAIDQRQMVDRIGEMIVEADAPIVHGEFPMVFTGFHDLSYSYLIDQMLLYQKRDIAAIVDCVDQLRMAPMAKALAEEALGMSKGHLDTLQDLADSRSSAKA